MTPAFAILVLAFVAPLIGAGCISLVPYYRPGLMRRFSLVASSVSLVCATALVIYVVSGGIVRGTIMGVAFGIDGMSVALFGTNALLGLVSVLYSRVVDNAKAYFWTISLAHAGTVGAFSSLSLIGFWAFWMVTVVCICLLIGRWGSRDSDMPAERMVPPVFSVLAVMGVAFSMAGSSLGGYGFPDGAVFALSEPMQIAVFGLLLAAFGSTIGLFPLHFWLPPAHERLTAGPGLLLDGSLFSMGVYGLVRIAVLLAPVGFASFRLPLAVVAAVSVLYGAFGLVAQHDLRRVTAYVTISYAGLIGLAVATGTQGGMVAAIILAVGRVAASSLFIIANQMIHARMQTLDLRELSGIATPLPLIAALLCAAAAGLVGIPALSALPGLILTLQSVYGAGIPVAVIAIAILGFFVMALALCNDVIRVCVGAPSDPVVAYVRHLAKDPFDIIVAGQRVPVDVNAPEEEAPFEEPTFTGDLEGLSSFEFAEPVVRTSRIPIERLRESIKDASAVRIANPQSAEELSVIDELAGIADIPINRAAAAETATEQVVSDDEWEEAARILRFDAPSHDAWDDFSSDDDDDDDMDDDSYVEPPLSKGNDFAALDSLVIEWDSGALDEASGESGADLGSSSEAQPKSTDGFAELESVLAETPILIDLNDDDDEDVDVAAASTASVKLAEEPARVDRTPAVATVEEPVRIPRRKKADTDKVISMRTLRERDDEEMIDSLIEQLKIIEQGEAELRNATSLGDGSAGEASGGARREFQLIEMPVGGRSSGKGRRRRAYATPSSVVRTVSPDDPEAYEVLDDHTSDPSFRRSTLTWSDLGAAALLLATMLGFGLGSSILTMLVDPTVAVLWQSMVGIGL